MKQVIVRKEAIEETDASVKNGNIAGVQKIEDTHECASIRNSVWYSNWRKNVVLAATSKIVLNLVETVVWNMR